MSRFVDPKATKRFVIGPCECPGSPHDEDWLDVRAQLSGVELELLDSAAPAARLRLLVVAWNLIERDGTTAPLDDVHLSLVYGDWFIRFNEWLAANVQMASLPNASAAPSPGSSRESGSLTLTTPTAV